MLTSYVSVISSIQAGAQSFHARLNIRRALREDDPVANKLELSDLACASQMSSSHERGLSVRTKRLISDASTEEVDRIPAETDLSLRLRSKLIRKLSKLSQK